MIKWSHVFAAQSHNNKLASSIRTSPTIVDRDALIGWCPHNVMMRHAIVTIFVKIENSKSTNTRKYIPNQLREKVGVFLQGKKY
jgi:hypothetical protein